MKRLLLCIAALLASATALAQDAHIMQLRLDDTIQPVSRDMLLRSIHSAADAHADALLVELNTPGGTLDATRAMVSAIENSQVPVIVYVAPQGAHAGSAGFFLLESADIAAMAPGTNAGASHPVLSNGAQPDDVMKQKMENDAAALLRSITTRRGRNSDAAQTAVLQSKSFTPEEAQQQKLVDVIATDTDDLLRQINGRSITRFNGTAQTLHTWPARVVAIRPTLRESLLDRLMDPNAAVLLLVFGALLLYLEFHIPGTIVPGAVGALFLLAAIFSLGLLPIHHSSVALLLAGGVLLVLEAKFPSHGLLSLAGIAAITFGLLTLIEAPVPEMRVRVSTAVAIALGFGIVTFIIARLAWKARRQKSLTGASALVGMTAQAQTALNPEGQVLVRGEIWHAVADTHIARGEHVKIESAHGLTLHVSR